MRSRVDSNALISGHLGAREIDPSTGVYFWWYRLTAEALRAGVVDARAVNRWGLIDSRYLNDELRRELIEKYNKLYSRNSKTVHDVELAWRKDEHGAWKIHMSLPKDDLAYYVIDRDQFRETLAKEGWMSTNPMINYLPPAVTDENDKVDVVERSVQKISSDVADFGVHTYPVNHVDEAVQTPTAASEGDVETIDDSTKPAIIRPPIPTTIDPPAAVGMLTQDVNMRDLLSQRMKKANFSERDEHIASAVNAEFHARFSHHRIVPVEYINKMYRDALAEPAVDSANESTAVELTSAEDKDKPLPPVPVAERFVFTTAGQPPPPGPIQRIVRCFVSLLVGMFIFAITLPGLRWISRAHSTFKSWAVAVKNWAVRPDGPHAFEMFILAAALVGFFSLFMRDVTAVTVVLGLGIAGILMVDLRAVRNDAE